MKNIYIIWGIEIWFDLLYHHSNDTTKFDVKTIDIIHIHILFLILEPIRLKLKMKKLFSWYFITHISPFMSLKKKYPVKSDIPVSTV